MSASDAGFSGSASIELRHAGRWLSGGTPDTGEDRYWGGNIPWISAASLKSFEINDSERRVTELGVRSGSRLVPEGTVMFVVRGMSLKNEFRVGITGRPVAFGQDCKAIIPGEGIDGRYLAYFLLSRSDFFLRSADESGHGTKRLETRAVADVKLPLLPLPEQRKIVEVLDAVDESIDAAERTAVKMDILRVGAVSSLIDSPCFLEDLGSYIISGPQNGLYKHQSAYGGSGIPILRIDGFGGGVISEPGSLRRLSVTPEEGALYGLKESDLVINRVNAIDYVGKSAIVRGLRELTVFESNIMRVKVQEEKLLPAFAAHMLSGSKCLRYFRSQARSAIAQASINQRDVRSCPIAVPSLDEQHRIVSVIETHDARIAAERAQLGKLRKLKAGLMDDLLTGRVRVDQLENLPV
ncbi:type I restriction enzyme S subunit [Spinactinospora alkalitolerans]|uniref:Type I restriction enzyme S subunit n=1 Tax=Spinactinospora alkalitolerans TaxID=687207 RepID=A0A852TZX9_9ACTN|nr:restriction endonuclease subunit S [Spinactinospora alkalitolerans]NYE48323.1 type I restriction enzyme S subunit [Spinactinospora alkalitolerans]